MLLPIDGHSTGVQLEGLPSKTSAQVRLGLLSSMKKLQDKYRHEAELEFAKKKI